MEDTLLRQLQMFRGSVHNKMVASKAALQSLESVATCSLPDNERSKPPILLCYYTLEILHDVFMKMANDVF
jgi:hypothetical protein